MRDTTERMLDEIAAGLRAGDEDICEWLRDQLDEAGASEIAINLAMGVISRLMPDDGSVGFAAAAQWDRRRLH